uniref:DH domain-containing protein n=1 Tax=Vespula pensylvanica TaxID=30213 RepID=A0A834P4C6_VESPE|nr:hypothetical protein H0235_007299 [Vespula pensylvanica]
MASNASANPIESLLSVDSRNTGCVRKERDTRTHVVVELYDTERSYVEALQILVNVKTSTSTKPEPRPKVNRYSLKSKKVHQNNINCGKLLVISGGDGYEDFRGPQASAELQAGREDSTNHLLLWKAGVAFYDIRHNTPWESLLSSLQPTCQHRHDVQNVDNTDRSTRRFFRQRRKVLWLLLVECIRTRIRTKCYQHHFSSFRFVVQLCRRNSSEQETTPQQKKSLAFLLIILLKIADHSQTFIRHDLVTIASNQGTRKERALFLFSDLLVITSIKRRSGTISKPSTSTCPSSLISLLEANKYEILMRIPLDDLEVIKAKDENLRRMAREVDHQREDCATLSQLQELAITIRGNKAQLEDPIKDMLCQTQRQLAEINAAPSQLACLELTLNTQSGIENISVVFTKPDKRASWEESFNEAKQKLVLSADRRLCPEFVCSLPIRKTRAGLQLTCAAPTLSNGQEPCDVWVCNSDGYVGQVCVLSLSPEPPQVTSCNGVCNARILCVAGIPASTPGSNSSASTSNTLVNSKSGISISVQDVDSGSDNIQLDSSSSDDSDLDDIPNVDVCSATFGSNVSNVDNATVSEEDPNQPTMIAVYTVLCKSPLEKRKCVW